MLAAEVTAQPSHLPGQLASSALAQPSAFTPFTYSASRWPTPTVAVASMTMTSTRLITGASALGLVGHQHRRGGGVRRGDRRRQRAQRVLNACSTTRRVCADASYRCADVHAQRLVRLHGPPCAGLRPSPCSSARPRRHCSTIRPHTRTPPQVRTAACRVGDAPFRGCGWSRGGAQLCMLHSAAMPCLAPPRIPLAAHPPPTSTHV